MKSLQNCWLSSPRRSIKHECYFRNYEFIFERFRGKDITFIEVGVLGGGSLFMWREYFGPQARIIGLEANPDALELCDHGFEIIIGDQSDPEFWKTVQEKVGSADILLDDGGHTYKQQITTLQAGLELVADQGIIVVEDTHTSYQPGFGPLRYSFINYIKEIVDHRHTVGLRTLPNSRVLARVANICIFDSMVALMLDEKRASTSSRQIDNGGHDPAHEDFRYGGAAPAFIKRIQKYAKLISWRKREPGLTYGSFVPNFILQVFFPRGPHKGVKSRFKKI